MGELVNTPNVPVYEFFSRPDIKAPILEVHAYDQRGIAPGYIFITPNTKSESNSRPVPAIYDNDGKLIWVGHEGVPSGVLGDSIIQSSSISYQLYLDVPQCEGASVTYIKNCFFEDVHDGETFVWNAIDHIPVSESMVCPGQDPIVGGGHSKADAFDYFHINSIDKDENGDYLISARHTSTIYKIAGPKSPNPGEIIWRLGGLLSDFKFPNSNMKFEYQHHVVWDNTIESASAPGKIGISLWDGRRSEPQDQAAELSSAKSFIVDEVAKTASLIENHFAPDKALDKNEGNSQLLSNGNHFIGYGSLPKMAEVDSKSRPVLLATIGDADASSYSAFRFEWDGQASSLAGPMLLAYAETCQSRVHYYISMNGQTTVDHYKLFTSEDQISGFRLSAKTERTGFESRAEGPYNLFAYAEAFDASGAKLGKSKTVKIFVPRESLAEKCGPQNCGFDFDYKESNARKCTAPKRSTIVNVTPPEKKALRLQQRQLPSVTPITPTPTTPRGPTTTPRRTRTPTTTPTPVSTSTVTVCFTPSTRRSSSPTFFPYPTPSVAARRNHPFPAAKMAPGQTELLEDSEERAIVRPFIPRKIAPRLLKIVTKTVLCTSTPRHTYTVAPPPPVYTEAPPPPVYTIATPPIYTVVTPTYTVAPPIYTATPTAVYTVSSAPVYSISSPVYSTYTQSYVTTGPVGYTTITTYITSTSYIPAPETPIYTMANSTSPVSIGTGTAPLPIGTNPATASTIVPVVPTAGPKKSHAGAPPPIATGAASRTQALVGATTGVMSAVGLAGALLVGMLVFSHGL